MRKKKSPIWDHFDQIDNKQVKCMYCSSNLAVTLGSSSNLTRHMNRKHPTIPITLERQVASCSTTVAPAASIFSASDNGQEPPIQIQENPPPRPPPLPSRKQPIPISDFLISKKPLPVRKSQELDRQLVKMIAKGYFPFSTVEDPEFIKFIEMLNPSYKLPTRKTLSNSLLPKFYEEVRTDVEKEVAEAEALCVTTDGWTSSNNDSFIAVTAHFIDNVSKMKSYLLDCVEYRESHTATNLAQFLTDIFQKWNISHKVSAVVSDNASNILAAVRAGKWRSIGCFAHKINLILQDALGKSNVIIPNTIGEVINKVKAVVQFFKKSSQAKSKLTDMQKNMNLPQLKLKQDCPTRWNSTYDMLRRVFEIKDSLISTLALLRPDLSLSPHDWDVIESAVQILKVFYDVTTEVCGENYVTLSKVSLYYRIMMDHIIAQENKNSSITIEIIQLTDDLKSGLETRFREIESDVLVSEATLLDPRFKKKGFKFQHNYERALERIKNRLIGMRTQSASRVNQAPPVQSVQESQPSPSTAMLCVTASIWAEFDEEIANLVPDNPTAAGIRELDRYLQEDYLKRTNDPLQWWESRKTTYPLLYDIVKKRLCLAATSVPCERIFSKAGQILIEKRSRLTSSKVTQLLFLNQNM